MLGSGWREGVDCGILGYRIKAADTHGVSTGTDASSTDFLDL